jgi:hypothetical protein
MTLSFEVHNRLAKLLPRLAAITDKHRLKVLSDIDRVLLSAGISWHDVANALQPPPQYADHNAADVLAIVKRIEARRYLLSDNAQQFVAQVREDATGEDTVELSERQAHWLARLHEEAEAEEAERPALRLVTSDGDAA